MLYFLVQFSVACTIFLAISLFLLPLLLKTDAETKRVLSVIHLSKRNWHHVPHRHTVIKIVFRSIETLRRKLKLNISQISRERLSLAGLRSPLAAELFFAAHGIFPLMGCIFGSFIAENTLFWIILLGAVGYLLPGIWVNILIRRRKDRIRRGLPDTIDLLVICVDAGLGIDQALLRVCEELSVSHPDIHEELKRLQLEQLAGHPRLEAWQDLAKRTKIEELSAFTSMLSQTERFGTPIHRALLSFSEELRQRRRQRAEEAAAKTKIKILFPLVFCIFPCIFIVLLVPAILNIMSDLGNK